MTGRRVTRDEVEAIGRGVARLDESDREYVAARLDLARSARPEVAQVIHENLARWLTAEGRR